MSTAQRLEISSRTHQKHPHLVTAENQTSSELDRSIGDIIRETKQLNDDQVSQILTHQKHSGLRFGEAAVALGMASDADVLYALSQQFHYPYAPSDKPSINSELVAAAQPFGPQAEAFRAIRSQLMLGIFSPSEPRRALAICSPAKGEGKTFFAVNLAAVMSQMGGRTLILDANMRAPRIHTIFNIPNKSGLSGILSGRQEEGVIFQAPDLPTLFVMPVGVTPPNPLELIERPAFRLLVGELLRKFDHVIVDTPAVASGMDGVVTANKCGSALIVARSNSSKLTDVQRLSANVASNGTRIAGAVLNDF